MSSVFDAALLPKRVLEESIYVYGPSDDDPDHLIRVPINADEILAIPTVNLRDVESDNEIELFVKLASIIDDGEAACITIAVTQGCILATDDRKACRVASDHQIETISTPTIIKTWADKDSVSPRTIADVIQRIERFAVFRPRQNTPLYDWWAAHRAS